MKEQKKHVLPQTNQLHMRKKKCFFTAALFMSRSSSSSPLHLSPEKMKGGPGTGCELSRTWTYDCFCVLECVFVHTTLSVLHFKLKTKKISKCKDFFIFFFYRFYFCFGNVGHNIHHWISLYSFSFLQSCRPFYELRPSKHPNLRLFTFRKIKRPPLYGLHLEKYFAV